MKKPNIKILVCYHKKYPVLRTNIFTPIHAGRARAPEGVKDSLKSMIGDDTGTNISEKNPYFCELTAIYWAWKNPGKLGNPTHIGLCHYRRIFNFRDSIDNISYIRRAWISRKTRKIMGWLDRTIEATCQNTDIILPTRTELCTESLDDNGQKFTTPITIYEQYSQFHHAKDLDLLLALIARKSSGHANTANRVINNYSQTYFFNMFVMRRDIFERYAEFVFSVLLEAEKGINIADYDQYNSRVFGFLAERLMPVFIGHLRSEEPAVRIEERPIVFLEGVTLTYYLKSIIAPYIPPPVLSARRKLLRMIGNLNLNKPSSKTY